MSVTVVPCNTQREILDILLRQPRAAIEYPTILASCRHAIYAIHLDTILIVINTKLKKTLENITVQSNSELEIMRNDELVTDLSKWQ